MTDQILELKTELERIDGQVWRAEQDLSALRARTRYLLGWIERIKSGLVPCFCQSDRQDKDKPPGVRPGTPTDGGAGD